MRNITSKFQVRAFNKSTGEEIDLLRAPRGNDEGEYFICPTGLLWEIGVVDSQLWIDHIDANLVIEES